MIDLTALKMMLVDVAGIEGLTETIIGGRRVYTLNGLTAAVDMNADAAAAEAAIRNAVGVRTAASAAFTPPPPTQPQGKPMSRPPVGSFAASLRAMMDESRDSLARARADGLKQVAEAVEKLNDAKSATRQVAGTMARTIEDEAAAVLSELGQISNDLG